MQIGERSEASSCQVALVTIINTGVLPIERFSLLKLREFLVSKTDSALLVFKTDSAMVAILN